jgi:hypothetical protein
MSHFWIARVAVAAALLACLRATSAMGASLTARISLTQAPLVMRLGKDEFRIAFGLSGSDCLARGCSGVIRYHVVWRTEEGRRVSDIKQVSFEIPANNARGLTVDREYFDTAEGAHTTEVIDVQISEISCVRGTLTAGGSAAHTAP